MSKLVIGLVLSIGVLLAAPTAIKYAEKLFQNYRTEVMINKTVKDQQIPKMSNALEIEPVNKVGLVSKTMTLENDNIVTFRGPVTESSVANAMRQLQEKSRKLPSTTPIYLILDSPGGSISDGLDLIDFMNALPQKVHTVTLFAASMAFQFVQNMDTRYIIRNGTLMSHCATIGGLGGQVKGEFEARYKMIRRKVDYLDFVASKRMSMSVADYDKLVINEYWVHGFDAVDEKAADEQVLLRCGKSLEGSEDVIFDTLFGRVSVSFSKCPLIRAPEKISFEGISNKQYIPYLQYVFKLAIEDKRRFVQEYITTDKFGKVFPQ